MQALRATVLSCMLFAGFIGACSSKDREGRPTASSGTTHPFEIAGVRVSVPVELVAVSAEERAELVPANAASNLELVARRTADRSVVVVLQTERLPLVASGGERVKDYLTELLAALLAEQSARGSTPRAHDGGVEQCVEGRDVRGRHIHACAHAYIDSREVAIRIVTCFAEPSRRGICRPIVDSRVFETSGARPLEEILEATASPGLAEVDADRFGWIRFGASRDDFHAGCRDAGERYDMPVPADEPPMVHASFREGTIAHCSGFGARLSVGEVTKVLARFHGDRLIEASLYVAAPFASVSASLRSAYPDYIANGDSTVHYVDRGAADSAILGISMFPSVARPGESLIVVQSRVALDALPR